jgi:hypothetical protein
MAWTSLTVDSFRERFTDEEFNALLAESTDIEGKLNEILGQVALEIVSRVNVGRRKRGLSPAVNTGLYIPPGSQRHAYTLALKLLTDCFPSLFTYNGEDRKAAVETAERHLEDLAKNDIDSDDDGAAEYASATSSSVRYGGKDILDFISPY